MAQAYSPRLRGFLDHELPKRRLVPRVRPAGVAAAGHSSPESALPAALRVFVGEAHPRDNCAALAHLPLAASAADAPAHRFPRAPAAGVLEATAAALQFQVGS